MEHRRAALHGVAVMPDDCWPGRVLFDIDDAAELSDAWYSVAPATLTFEQASECDGGLSLAGEAFEPTIDDIVLIDESGDGRFTWLLTGLGVEMRVTAGLWTVEQRLDPVTIDRQRLRPGERGGVGFPRVLDV